jgi:hypothetical protein
VIEPLLGREHHAEINANGDTGTHNTIYAKEIGVTARVPGHRNIGISGYSDIPILGYSS